MLLIRQNKHQKKRKQKIDKEFSELSFSSVMKNQEPSDILLSNSCRSDSDVLSLSELLKIDRTSVLSKNFYNFVLSPDFLKDDRLVRVEKELCSIIFDITRCNTGCFTGACMTF